MGHSSYNVMRNGSSMTFTPGTELMSADVRLDAVTFAL